MSNLISGPGDRAIEMGDRVRLHFSLHLETGEIAGSHTIAATFTVR